MEHINFPTSNGNEHDEEFILTDGERFGAKYWMNIQFSDGTRRRVIVFLRGNARGYGKFRRTRHRFAVESSCIILGETRYNMTYFITQSRYDEPQHIVAMCEI